MDSALFLGRAKRFLSGKQIPEEDEIAGQAIARILKGSGLVLFKKVMPHPGKAITQDGNEGEKNPVKGKEKGEKRKDDQTGTDKMQAPAGGVLVLGEVKGVKVLQGGKTLFAHAL